MSEYLAYVLWRNREQSISRDLEYQRVIRERLHEQTLEVEGTQQTQRLVGDEVARAVESEETPSGEGVPATCWRCAAEVSAE